VLQAVPAGDSESLMLEEPLVCVADDQFGRACAGDRSRLASGVSERCVDHSHAFAGHRDLPGAASVHFDAYCDFDCARTNALIVAEVDRGHEFTSPVSWRVCPDYSPGVSVGAPRLVSGNYGRHDVSDRKHNTTAIDPYRPRPRRLAFIEHASTHPRSDAIVCGQSSGGGEEDD